MHDVRPIESAVDDSLYGPCYTSSFRLFRASNNASKTESLGYGRLTFRFKMSIDELPVCHKDHGPRTLQRPTEPALGCGVHNSH